MIKKLLFLLTALICAALSACVQVPYTRISGDLTKGTFVVRSPKNGTLEGLDITRGTNGTVHIVVLKHTVLMDPAVIQSSTDQIKAHWEGAGAVVKEAVQTAIESAKKVP